MEEEKKVPEKQEEELPKLRGLYEGVNISVRALDCIIIACIAVILIVAFTSIH